MSKICRSVLTWLAQQGWSPSREKMAEIANNYDWRVEEAPFGEKEGTFAGDHIIWIPLGYEKLFWHALGHIKNPYYTPFSDFYLKWYFLTHPKTEEFSQKPDNQWQMADYYLNELLATFQGYILAIKWWIKIGRRVIIKN